jgi:ribosomal protein S8E
MMNPTITRSGNFLMMPPSTQALYFQLLQGTDDDGVAEAYSVMRLIGSKEDEIAILVAKQFITVLDPNQQVIWINHWHDHNKIRSEHLTPSIYRELLVQVIPGIYIKESKKEQDTQRRVESRRVKQMSAEDKQRTNSGSAECPPRRIGKDSVVKDNNTTDVAEAPAVEKNEVYRYWEEVIGDITTSKETQRKAAVTLLNRYGADNCLKMVRVVAHAHSNQYARKEVKCLSLGSLLANWDKVAIYAKAQSAQASKSVIRGI